jgi:very-short-patch-repair endonuclease
VSVGAINRVARRQHGLVTREQLVDLGMRPRAIDRRVESRRLIRIRRGVYRVGPIAQQLEPEMAAILAVGPGSAISHDYAVALHELHPYPAKDGFVDVTVAGRQPGPKPGIRIHRTAHLPDDEVTHRHRIPVTTPARTIIDVAPHLGDRVLEQLLAEAHRRRLGPRVLTLIARYPNRPGVPAVRKMLQDKPKFTRSKAERRFLEAFRRAGLPPPETNAELAGYEVDFLWRDERVVLEVDGGPFHSTRPDRKRDYARDAELQALRYAVIRVDADDAPERALALIARATR